MCKLLFVCLPGAFSLTILIKLKFDLKIVIFFHLAGTFSLVILSDFKFNTAFIMIMIFIFYQIN